MAPEEMAELVKLLADELEARREAAGIDWSKVPVPKVRNTRPQCSDLSSPVLFRLTLIAEKDYGGSLGGVLKTAVMCYLRTKWPHHVEDFRAIAAREGITIEECLIRIGNGTLKP